MTTAHLPSVIPTSEFRKLLPTVLGHFRAEGSLSAPVIVGAHRKAEAAVLPIELYEQLLPAIEEISLANQVRARLNDPRPSESFDDVARAVGIDPDSL